MRFNYKDYDKAFPREAKKKIIKPDVDPEDKMTNDIEKPEEKIEQKVEEVLEDGNTGTGESDTE